MSKLDGHRAITNQAIQEVGSSCISHMLGQNLMHAGIPSFVVKRDLLDVANGGHWADFAQKHHFMREFDGQSPYEAYSAGVNWIQSNALDASKVLARRVKKYFDELPKPGIATTAGAQSCQLSVLQYKGDHTSARRVMAGYWIQTYHQGGGYRADPPDWQTFGNALHALQDSFAIGHVLRTDMAGGNTPGSIEHIKIYAGDEVEGHSHYDKLWWDTKKNQFSRDGRLAINASKDLIISIINTANTSGEIQLLQGWSNFKNKWLVASDKLSHQRDIVLDLILKHYSGTRVGNNNMKTYSFDEEGLANDIISELGTRTKTITQLFKRLKESYSSDSDDVAMLYVQKIQEPTNLNIAVAIKKDKVLTAFLIKIMESGWTSNKEEKCIEFLER